MDVASAVANVNAIKGAFLILGSLALTNYKSPAHQNVQDASEFDYVIVGGGTAGSIVANRLTEDPGVTVCLIEAGGDPPLEAEMPALFAFLPKSNIDWNFTSEDDGSTALNRKNKNINLPSGKVLGGSSTMDHFVYVRGDPTDYDDWVKASGDDSWSWQNLLPYFIKSERVEDDYIMNSKNSKYHGRNGYTGVTRETRDLPLKYIKAFSEIGHNTVDNINAGQTLGYTRPMFTISKGIRQSTAESYLSPIKNRENLYVMKNTLVTKIVFDEDKQATGVQCTTSDGNNITINAQKEVIISAGAFNTPKLLMLSGVGPQQHLDSMGIDVVSDLPVGENLQDHVAVILLHTLETTNEAAEDLDPNQFPLPFFIGFGAVNKTQSQPDYMTMNAISRNNPATIMQLCAFVFTLDDDVCQQMAMASVGKETLFTILNVGRPSSSGNVLLQSTNPQDPPNISTGYLSSSDDIQKYVEGIEDFIQITESTYFREVGGETVYLNLPNCNNLTGNASEYWKCYISNVMDTTFHYSSTCAMGTVLDSSLRVKGVKNLRVVDASALPNVTCGNIKAAVMVMAEKAADLIKSAQTCA